MLPPPRSRRGPGPAGAFPPVADYGFLSDCETAALVTSRGAVEWLPVPRMDSASVFAAILDRDAGAFVLAPAGVTVPAARRYLPGTLVLETTWMTSSGWLTVKDALLMGSWGGEAHRPAWRRTPQDERAEHVLLRTATCTQGSVQLILDCAPSFAYGATPPRWRSDDATGAIRARGEDGDPELVLAGALRIGVDAGRAQARTTLRAGERTWLALAWCGGRPPADWAEADARLETTVDFWRRWLGQGRFPDHPWRNHLQRSAVVLKGLTYAPTGAVVAAATTSLPETPGGERNWDYRYTWLRDATFLLWGLATLGFGWEADAFFHFVADQCGVDAGDLQIMYGIDGERRLDERELDHLSGYDGARPVRVGNAAYDQAQHDVWGVVLDSIALHVEEHDAHLPGWLWPLVPKLVEGSLAHWRERDHGMWEVRGEPRHFTSSKLMCWVAVDRGARLARLRGEVELAATWEAAAAEIHADILAHGVDERGVFVQHYETRALDASNLLFGLLGFLPPDDARIRATVLAIADELTEDDLVLRYRVEETDDGLPGEEGAFVICSFWLVSALVEIGELARARDLCEKLLSYASPVGLYAEELDAHTGRHLGNTPQAFSHLAHQRGDARHRRRARAAPGGAGPRPDAWGDG
jgi:GH15 family glucan-1,4-alpha-glucosidase